MKIKKYPSEILEETLLNLTEEKKELNLSEDDLKKTISDIQKITDEKISQMKKF